MSSDQPASSPRSGQPEEQDEATSSLVPPLATSLSTAPASSNPLNPSHPILIDGHPTQIFSAPTAGPSTPQQDLPESFFEHTLSDAQAYQSTVSARSKTLSDAPLLVGKHRDEARSEREKRKSEKWPTTTIRVKFSDGTQIQSSFDSSSRIQPVYAYVRSALDPSASTKPFMLWQPPRTQYPERPIPQPKKNPNRSTVITPANYGPIRGSTTPGLQGGTGGAETLNDLGLVPQSVLLVKWEDEGMNGSEYPAPLLPELREASQPLPPPTIPSNDTNSQPKANGGNVPAPGEKKIPKWLQKGLMKRK